MNLYSFLLFITVIVFSNNSFSQINRMNDSERYLNRKPKEVKKSDVLNASLEYMKENLELDGFQEAVFKNLLKENDEKATQIINDESIEKKEKEVILEKFAEQFKIEAFKVLNESQKVKYEEIFTKSKDKKKKKK
jgi:hypothetical protein